MTAAHDITLKHQQLKAEIEKAILQFAQAGASAEPDQAQLLQLVSAATAALEECTTLQMAAIHQARRSGVSWSAIGELLGITRQAAQQRFATPITLPDSTSALKRIDGVNAQNEMSLIRLEEANGYHLTGFGPQYLQMQKSDYHWEHKRINALPISAGNKRAQIEKEGWVYVGSWLPYMYFKRVKDE